MNLLKIFVIVILVQLSCNTKNYVEYSTTELRNQVLDALATGKAKEFTYDLNRDTFFYFADGNFRLHLFKNSFLNLDSSIYRGVVMISFNFETDRDSILRDWIKKPEFDDGLSQIFGLVKFYAKGENGEQLLINPVFQPSLAFPEYSGIAMRIAKDKVLYHLLDTQKHIYSTVISTFRPFFEIQSENRKTKINNSIKDEFDINLEFIDTNDKNRNHVKEEKVLSLENEISYELSLISLGEYFIGWNDVPSLTPVNITVKIDDLDLIDGDIYLKVLFFTEAEVSKNHYLDHDHYYLVGKKINNSTYRIDKSVYSNSLILPTNRKYELFVYAISKGQYYYYLKKKIRLNSVNNFNIKFKEISQNDLIKVIKGL